MNGHSIEDTPRTKKSSVSFSFQKRQPCRLTDTTFPRVPATFRFGHVSLPGSPMIQGRTKLEVKSSVAAPPDKVGSDGTMTKSRHVHQLDSITETDLARLDYQRTMIELAAAAEFVPQLKTNGSAHPSESLLSRVTFDRTFGSSDHTKAQEKNRSGGVRRFGRPLPTASARLGMARTSYPDNPKSTAADDDSSIRPSQTRHLHWTPGEDEILKLAVRAEKHPVSWKCVSAKYFKGRRNADQCKSRWNHRLKPGIKRGGWTSEEDQLILDRVARGFTWKSIALEMPNRAGLSIRERFKNHLDPTLKKTGWTPEEDSILFHYQAKLGNRWVQIRKHLPGRSENAIKNRYHNRKRIMKRQLEDERSQRTDDLLFNQILEGDDHSNPALSKAVTRHSDTELVPEVGNNDHMISHQRTIKATKTLEDSATVSTTSFSL